MQCQIRESNNGQPDGENNDEDNRGIVTQVCREWLIHEDSALAYRLQEQEITHHYDQNRSQRRLVRDDLVQAKSFQDEESEYFYDENEAVVAQENADAEVARRLQEEYEREINLQKQSVEEADKELARMLQEKEKQKLHRIKMEKEQRQLRAMAAAEGGEDAAVGNGRNIALNYEDTLSRALHSTNLSWPQNGGDPNDEGLSDLSDFCIKPAPGMSQQQIATLQEKQDEELARLLQEQESKRKSQAYRDHQMAVEAQDRELAKLLQEKERARARKAKEKARQRALQKQMTEKNSNDVAEDVSGIPESYLADEDSGLELERSKSPSNRQKSTRPTDLDLTRIITKEPSSHHHQQQHTAKRSAATGKASYELERVGPMTSGSSNHINIAMAIDPTYKRRQHHHQHYERQGTAESGGSTPVLPTPVEMNSGSPHDEVYESDEEEVAPPYMPIQGQRRQQTLEHQKKQKGNKESCKQQ